MKIDIIYKKKIRDEKYKQLNKQLSINITTSIYNIIYNNNNNNNSYKIIICFLQINILLAYIFNISILLLIPNVVVN